VSSDRSRFPACGDIHIVRLADLVEMPISQRTGNPKDQGWSMNIINSEVNGSPDLLVGAFRCEPHEIHPPHFHNMGELYYVLHGECELTIGDRTQMISEGTAIYTPKGVAHGVRTFESEVQIMVVFPEGDWDKIEKHWLP
jgi:quercetin dioxygenase-like cupin family protein